MNRPFTGTKADQVGKDNGDQAGSKKGAGLEVEDREGELFKPRCGAGARQLPTVLKGEDMTSSHIQVAGIHVSSPIAVEVVEGGSEPNHEGENHYALQEGEKFAGVDLIVFANLDRGGEKWHQGGGADAGGENGAEVEDEGHGAGTDGRRAEELDQQP